MEDNGGKKRNIGDFCQQNMECHMYDSIYEDFMEFNLSIQQNNTLIILLQLEVNELCKNYI